jgi:hypothetical protein
MELAPLPTSGKRPALPTGVQQSAHLPMSCEPKHGRIWRLFAVLSLALLGCRSSLSGEVEGQKFVRCAQLDPPAERSYRAGELVLTVRGRALEVSAQGPLRIAAFTGPIGVALSGQDTALLTADRPQLALYLGGLGDTEALARDNLTRLAKLRIPTLFVAGGADRRAILEAAFASLPEAERDWIIDGTGLRELRVGDQRFVIAAGAPLGRYAVDEQGCGLTIEDVSAIQAAAAERAARRTYLLAWHAPAGLGITSGQGGVELGHPDLTGLAKAVRAEGGLFAFPEPQSSPAPVARAWVVPRLGRPGTQRSDGSRLRSQLGRYELTVDGLSPRP